MKLSTCIYQFFDRYLPHIKGCGPNTIKSYRDTFTIFVPFAADYLSIKTTSLTVEHLTPDVILAFLDHLQSHRGNGQATRNQRLATIKSLAKMIRFIYPDCTKTAERILAIPQRRKQRKLIGFLYPDEVLKVLASVDLRKPLGMRDYALLNLLYDSGARASEVANLNLDYFDPDNRTLAILGKGNHYRQIELLPKTVEIVSLYIEKYRPTPHPLHRQRLFINQRGRQLTRHGIYKICRKYLFKTLTPKRLKDINPAHSFRHSCAIKMLSCGDAASDIQNRLGHVNTESTMVYLRIDMRRKRTVQKQFMAYAQQLLSEDPKLDELIDWENKQDILTWLDSL